MILYIIYFTLNFSPTCFGEVDIVREFTPVLRFLNRAL